MTKKLEISREQFESANPVPFGIFWSEPDSRYMTTMVHLNCLEYQGKWLGWQSAINAADPVPPLIQILQANGDRIAMEATIAQQAQVMGRVYTDDGVTACHLNSIGRALPDGTPLYAEQPARLSCVCVKII